MILFHSAEPFGKRMKYQAEGPDLHDSARCLSAAVLLTRLSKLVNKLRHWWSP